MDRISRDRLKIETLKILSSRSTCLRRQVGCILVKDDRILMSGYNGLPTGMPNCCDTRVCLKEKYNSEEYKICIHSEQNVLAMCAKYGIPTEGTDLYVNADVCMTCAKLIIASGIARVVVLRDFAGKVGDAGIDLLRQCNVQVEIWNPEEMR